MTYHTGERPSSLLPTTSMHFLVYQEVSLVFLDDGPDLILLLDFSFFEYLVVWGELVLNISL
jgi:hypothetical protein